MHRAFLSRNSGTGQGSAISSGRSSSGRTGWTPRDRPGLVTGRGQRRGVARAVLWSRPRCRGGGHRDRVRGAGPVGTMLHIRPGPAVGGSAESCGNASAFNAGETLPCADRPPLHMGERRREVKDSRDPRNPADNLESSRGAAALPCAIRTPDRPGPHRPRGTPAPGGSGGLAGVHGELLRLVPGARRERGTPPRGPVRRWPR